MFVFLHNQPNLKQSNCFWSYSGFVQVSQKQRSQIGCLPHMVWP